jgi:hypothetical protein
VPSVERRRATKPKRFASRFGVLLGLAVALSCTGNPEVTFEIDVAQSIAAQTTWFEIGAFSNGYCQAVKPIITAGIPLDGAVIRVAFRRDNAAPPPIGDLRKGNYAFAAVARREDCGIVATGCVEVDVSSERAVRITMDPLPQAPGKCTASGKCSAGRCVPSNDNANVGAGCSLALLGAGPLGNALSTTGEFVSGPAIAASPTGFIVAYREVDNEGNARLTMLPLDAGGGALAPLVSARLNGGLLRDYCAEAAPTLVDSAAFFLGQGGGSVVLSHPACGAIGGVDIFPTDPSGIITGFGRSGGQGVSLFLSQAHAIYGRATGTPALAYVQNGQAEVAGVNGADLEPQERRGKFGGGTATDAWISGDRTLAFLALGTGGSTPPPPVDAGPDASRDSGAPPIPSGGRVLRLKTSDDLADLTKLTTATSVNVAADVSWGSLAVTGKRVLVLAPTTSEGSPVDLHAFDGNRELETSPTSVAVEGIGDATSGDVAIAGDRAFVAVLRRGEVSLVALDRITTSPTSFDPPRTVSFLRDSRIPSIAKIEDGKVAVASSGTRVAVAWSTASRLDINKPVGGYAIFACAP